MPKFFAQNLTALLAFLLAAAPSQAQGFSSQSVSSDCARALFSDELFQTQALSARLRQFIKERAFDPKSANAGQIEIETSALERSSILDLAGITGETEIRRRNANRPHMPGPNAKRGQPPDPERDRLSGVPPLTKSGDSP